MVELNRSDNTDGLFAELDKRSGQSAYFYRTAGYNDKIRTLISKYYSAACVKGAVLTGKLPAPDERQVSYFLEMLGRDFRMDKMFIGRSLGRWLPQLDNAKCTMLANAMLDTLLDFRTLGKNEAMIKNLYVRLMCWLYYRLGGMIAHIGENDPPRVLYGGELGRHELYLLTMLHRCKCDVLLLLTGGEAAYSSFDPQGRYSKKLEYPDMKPFPPNFDIKQLERADVESRKRTQLTGARAGVTAATNVWLRGDKILEDLKIVPVSRGKDEKCFYNSLCRITGVEDKLTYPNELYTFYMEIKNSGRRFTIIQDRIPMPDNDELQGVDRSPSKTPEQLIAKMLKSVSLPPNEDLKRLFSSAFADVLLEEAEKPGMTLQRLTTRAACVSCWLNRYGPALFNSWTMPLVSLFIYLGGCKSDHEAAFLRVLSRLPCDVLILVPNLNTKCLLEDPKLFELRYAESLNLTEYPTEASALQFGTAAYHAERELNSALYDGTGIYRDYQYKKANSVILKTMFEEIDILWKQDTKFRPNFSVIDGTVNVPVIFAKISGVKDSQLSKYWKSVQQMLTDNTFIIYGAPFISREQGSMMSSGSANLLRGGKLRREELIQSRGYRYAHLRRETQELIFDKIDLLISSNMIRGTFENGTEYLIAALLLDLPQPIIQLIQGFDFTKLNPKIIYINTGEIPISLEDSILTAFLSLVGFDVLFLVPTGYQTVENYFNKAILDEHKVGEYMYDVQVPKLKIPKTKPPAGKNKPLFGGLFRKGQ